MLNKDCSLLVLSCDKNINLLYIFYDHLRKNWNNCPYDIYFGIEKETVFFEGVKVINSMANDYSTRIKEYLQIIDSQYVLIMLDDFIIENEIDNAVIEKYESYIRNNNAIATLTLVWIDGKPESVYEEGIIKKDRNANYLVNLQVGYWNKSFLNNILKNGENPWQIELYGSIRARKYRNLLFLHLDKNTSKPITYNRGWLMVKGKWNGNEIKRLHLEKYAKDFLDGRPILYDGFGKIKKKDVIKIRMGVLVRKIASNLGWYF